MNTDVEDLLREGMERFTADLRAPAGLTHRIARLRRRRLALGSAAAVAGALTAGAVALAAVGLPGARDNGAGGQVLTADVVKRVDSALTATGPGSIAQMRVTTRGTVPGGATVTTTTEEWSYGGQWRSVTYSSAGHPVYDEGSSASSAYTVVSYLTRTWARQPGSRLPAVPVKSRPGCGPAIAVPLLFRFGLPGIGLPATSLIASSLFASSLPATVAKDLRTAISCGTLVVAGRQRVDGIEALKLTSRRGSPISETIWVSPDTYLPVRAVVGTFPGAPIFRQTADITWLRPTARNLAKLTVPIPAGFRQVPLVRAVLPILRQIPGRLLPKPQALCLAPAGPPAGPPLLAPAPGKLPVPARSLLPIPPQSLLPFHRVSFSCHKQAVKSR